MSRLKLLRLNFFKPKVSQNDYLCLVKKMGMDISAEKIEIIKRFEQINDAELIQAIKDLLDFKPSESDEALESALDHALKQSEAKQVKPHKEVMAEIRKRFQK